jgi:hypothetical protein
MSYEVDIDTRDLIAQAMTVNLALDQLPYAASRALNDSLQETRDTLIAETWPSHVNVRNTAFIRRVLHIEFSTKANLEGSIIENKGAVRGNVHLTLHDKGGMKSARGDFAIPTQNVTLTSFGPRADQKPTALTYPVRIGHTLFQRVKKGRHHSALVPMYRLAHTVNQPADVPFTVDFEISMRQRFPRHFMPRLADAMRTRRR